MDFVTTSFKTHTSSTISTTQSSGGIDSGAAKTVMGGERTSMFRSTSSAMPSNLNARRTRWGKFFVSSLPAINAKFAKAIRAQIRDWNLAFTQPDSGGSCSCSSHQPDGSSSFGFVMVRIGRRIGSAFIPYLDPCPVTVLRIVAHQWILLGIAIGSASRVDRSTE